MAAVTTAADAQPRRKPGATFGQPTSFSACSKSTMFACGMRDAAGHTYGTAKEITICTTYVFQPDGTYAVSSDSFPTGEHGTYRIVAGKVTMFSTPEGTDALGNTVPPLTTELPLSHDGNTLGGMKRVGR